MFFLYLFISVIVDDCTLYKFVLKKLKTKTKQNRTKQNNAMIWSPNFLRMNILGSKSRSVVLCRKRCSEKVLKIHKKKLELLFNKVLCLQPSSKFCKIIQNTRFTEYLHATANNLGKRE